MQVLQRIKKVYRFFRWHYFLVSNRYEHNKHYYVLKYGIGDTYLVSTLLHCLRKDGKKIVLIIEKSNQQFIPAMFDDSVCVKQVTNIPYELVAEFGHNSSGQPIVLHPDWIKDVSLVNLLGYRGFTLLDLYKLLLDLDFGKRPAVPRYNSIVSATISNQLSVHENLILLCPQANSIATVGSDFWLELAEFLYCKGFSPIFMNYSYSEKFDSISFPLDESIAVCNSIKGVISLRSGFCDLISGCQTAKVVLYPKIKWYSGSLMQGSSLKAMGISNGPLLELEMLDLDSNLILFNQIEIFLNE